MVEAMGTRGAGGLSLLLGLLLGVTVAVLVLALPVSSQATNVGCAADLKRKVTKFQTQSLHCKAYNFPAINPYIIWVRCFPPLGYFYAWSCQ